MKPKSFLSLLIVGCLSLAASPQSLQDIKKSSAPLVLASQGSFYVGGDVVKQSPGELGSFGPGGSITVNQMYVHYLEPQHKKGLPVVMIHGMTLTGKTWETTPDGRMGWQEYFVRKGYPVYLVDQVGRGRSGFNQAPFNNARTGQLLADKIPPMWRFSDEVAIPNFRIGTQDGTPYSNGQFPAQALPELSRQAVPDVTMGVPNPNPTYKALSDLAGSLEGAILMSHSQSGAYPIEAALLNAKGIAAMILVEPGGCPGSLKPEQLTVLSKIPTMILFGDNLGQVTGVPHSWQTAYDGCKSYVSEISKAGGTAEIIALPELGIKGNSHMLMQDRNNQQVADILIDWINKKVIK